MLLDSKSTESMFIKREANEINELFPSLTMKHASTSCCARSVAVQSRLFYSCGTEVPPGSIDSFLLTSASPRTVKSRLRYNNKDQE